MANRFYIPQRGLPTGMDIANLGLRLYGLKQQGDLANRQLDLSEKEQAMRGEQFGEQKRINEVLYGKPGRLTGTSPEDQFMTPGTKGLKEREVETQEELLKLKQKENADLEDFHPLKVGLISAKLKKIGIPEDHPFLKEMKKWSMNKVSNAQAYTMAKELYPQYREEMLDTVMKKYFKGIETDPLYDNSPEAQGQKFFINTLAKDSTGEKILGAAFSDTITAMKKREGATTPKPQSDIGKLQADRERLVQSYGEDSPVIKAIDAEIQNKAAGTTAKPNETMLITEALREQLGREPTAREVLDEQEKRKLRIAEATRQFTNPVPFHTWDQSEKEFWFQHKLRTGYGPRFGFGDRQSYSEFNSEYARWASGKGITGEAAGTKKAEFKALSTSLNTQEKVRGMMGGFVRNINKQVDRVDEIMADVISRVGIRAIDYPMRELRIRVVGSGNEAVITGYLTEISNEIGKLSTGSAASIRELSTDAQERWAKIHDPNLSLGELKKILLETKNMGNMRVESSDEEIKRTKALMKEAPEPESTKVVPRKPGETIADYLKRTGSQ